MEFNARKIQCCLLTHKRIFDSGHNVCMDGMEIAKSETLDVLGTSIRSDLRLDDHVFNVSKEAAKCLSFIGDDGVGSSITSLGYRRNLNCVVLFYKYYFGQCSSGLSELIPPSQVFARNTRLSGRNHAYTVASMYHCTTHYRENSFFTRTA